MFRKCWSKCVLVVLVILILETVVYLNIRSNENGRELLRANLTNEIALCKEGKVQYVNLSEITTFAWETLFVFAPYTEPDRIDSTLGAFWLGSRFTTIDTNDGIALLVFVKNGRVIQYLEFPRQVGDFAYAANSIGYDISESRFAVDSEGRMIWLGD